MRRILIVSFYYPPDLSAGSFRISAFVEALSRLSPDDVVTEVVTTSPNRYHSYDRKAPESETAGNVTIRRFKLPGHKSGFRDQAVAFSSFNRNVRNHAQGLNYDLVFATSSRLMTAALGASLARRARVPLYLDIRDIFTDTMNNLLSWPPKVVVMPVLKVVEKRTVAKAKIVNLVSRGFSDHFSTMKDASDLRFYTNGIDPEFVGYDFSSKAGGDRRTQILYAGNFGEGQGLHKIVPQAAIALGSRFEFLMIGDGGRKTELVDSCQKLDNVTFRDPVGRDELMRLYADADILFLHLNDYPAFRKVLPSKIFEYAATGKPMLAGVAGFAAQFVADNVENAAVFDPCIVESMIAALDNIRIQPTQRTDFIHRYRRENIMEEMARDVLQLLPENGVCSTSGQEVQ
jgi:glycosyltransferase involved in cell wall biosynthesis